MAMGLTSADSKYLKGLTEKQKKEKKKEALKVERIKRRNERLAKVKGRGKPGSSKGAMAVKAAAKKRIAEGKSTATGKTKTTTTKTKYKTPRSKRGR